MRRRTPAPPAARRRPSPRGHGTRRSGPPDRLAAGRRPAARRPRPEPRSAPPRPARAAPTRRSTPISEPPTSISADAGGLQGAQRGRDRRLRDAATRSGARPRSRPVARSGGVRRWLSATMRTIGTARIPGSRQVSSRIVGGHGADAHHHRVMPGAQRVGRAARLGAGDPAALAGMGRDPAVERGGELERDQRPARAARGSETLPSPRPPRSRSTPSITSIPAARSRAMPPPSTRGSGSRAADHDARDRPPRSARRCRAASGRGGSRVRA